MRPNIDELREAATTLLATHHGSGMPIAWDESRTRSVLTVSVRVGGGNVLERTPPASNREWARRTELAEDAPDQDVARARRRVYAALLDAIVHHVSDYTKVIDAQGVLAYRVELLKRAARQ